MKPLPLLIAATLLLTNTAAFSDIYSWKDENGTLKFSDRKPKGEYQVHAKTTPNSASDNQRSTSESATNEASTPLSRTFESVDAIIKAHQPAIEQLYSSLHDKDPLFQGTIKLQFSVNADGTITQCNEDESGMHQKATVAFNGELCKLLKTLNYGAVRSPSLTNVNYALTHTVDDNS